MATSIGNLAVVLSTNSAAFVAGIKQAEKQMAGLRASVESAASGVHASLGSLAGLAAGIGTTIGAVKLASWGMETAAALEQAENSFATLLGSADLAKAMVADLQKMASQTPFSQESIVKAAQALQVYGVSARDTLPLLQILGDAASVAPGGLDQGLERITRALGQMKTRGKVTASEMLQLSEAGIPAWEMLAKAAGTSVADIQDKVSRGLIDAETGIAAILAGMQGRFAGNMARQSATLAGLWSTLKDNAAITMADVAKSFSEGMGLKGALSDVSGWFESIRPAAQAFGKSLGEAARAGWEVARAVKDVGTAASALVSLDLTGVFATDPARSWRAATIDSLETVARGFASFGDSAILTATEIEAAYTKLQANLYIGWLQYRKSLVPFTLYPSEAEKDKEVGTLNSEIVRMVRIRNELEAKLKAQREGAGKGQGALGKGVGAWFADFRKQDAARVAAEFKSAWDDVWNGTIKGAKDARAEVEKLDLVQRSLTNHALDFAKAGASGLGDFLRKADEARKQWEPLARSIVADLERGTEMKSPAALMAGSTDAYSLLVQRDIAGRGGDTPDQRIAALTEKALKEQEKQSRLLDRVLAELKNRGVLKIEDLD